MQGGMKMTNELTALLAKARNNLDEISKAGGQCSCFFCIRQFHNSDIHAWTDGGATCICPNCGVDALIPGVISTETLKQMNEEYFTG